MTESAAAHSTRPRAAAVCRRMSKHSPEIVNRCSAQSIEIHSEAWRPQQRMPCQRNISEKPHLFMQTCAERKGSGAFSLLPSQLNVIITATSRSAAALTLCRGCSAAYAAPSATFYDRVLLIKRNFDAALHPASAPRSAVTIQRV